MGPTTTLPVSCSAFDPWICLPTVLLLLALQLPLLPPPPLRQRQQHHLASAQEEAVRLPPCMNLAQGTLAGHTASDRSHSRTYSKRNSDTVSACILPKVSREAITNPQSSIRHIISVFAPAYMSAGRFPGRKYAQRSGELHHMPNEVKDMGSDHWLRSHYYALCLGI